MTELTATYVITDLRKAVEQRRIQRRAQQAAAERHARQIALDKAAKQRADWIAALRADKSAVRILPLLGLSPEDSQIDPDRYHIYLHGDAPIAPDALLSVTIVQNPQGATYNYANLTCACPAANYEREYRGLTLADLADRILDAAEEALTRIEAAQDSRQADAIWGNGG